MSNVKKPKAKKPTFKQLYDEWYPIKEIEKEGAHYTKGFK